MAVIIAAIDAFGLMLSQNGWVTQSRFGDSQRFWDDVTEASAKTAHKPIRAATAVVVYFFFKT